VRLYKQCYVILITFIYFSGLLWDEDLGAFLESTSVSPSFTELSPTCVICDLKAAKKKSETPILNLGSIFYLGTVYHKFDFIYVLNEQDEDASYKIGQILSLSEDNAGNTVQVQIRQLKHYDDFAMHELNSFNLANWMKDEVCSNNFVYSFTYIALPASPLLHIKDRNHFH
jgi:hypothetical protein